MATPLNPIPLACGEVLNFHWGQITWLVSRSLDNSEKQTFGRVKIKAHDANPLHRHPNCDEILHVIRGKIEHTFEEKSFIMNVGDTISIPAGTLHNARALGDSDAEMVICFSSADRQTESDGEEA